MPIFGLGGTKFSPRKATHRKSAHSLNADELEELVSENGIINLKLGDNACVFQQGNWSNNSTLENGTSTTEKSISKLQNRVEELQEENYLLQIKLEILLHMLTETTAENHLQHREIEKLKNK